MSSRPAFRFHFNRLRKQKSPAAELTWNRRDLKKKHKKHQATRLFAANVKVGQNTLESWRIAGSLRGLAILHLLPC